MRVLVTGASGMLGGTLVECWRTRHEVLATGSSELAPPDGWRYRPFDLAARDHGPLVAWAQPEIIVHCAAWTAVDACERDPERAMDLNGHAVERLLAAAPDARMIYISTDAVFGERTEPRTELDPPDPINAYGRGKLLGERAVLARATGTVVRTTVVGWNRDPRKQSFAEWIVRSVTRGESITLFTDQRFDPIAASALADELEHLAATPRPGVWHVAARAAATKHAFGVELCKQLGLDVSLIRAGSIADARFAAPRAADQRLAVASYERAFGRRLPSVGDTIATLVREQVLER